MNEVMQNHIGFWVMAKVLYHKSHKHLLDEKLAYRGLLARKAVENLDQFLKSTTYKFYFVGFNAFTNAERQIVETMLSESKAECYWDSDSYYMNDDAQEAGLFLRKYKKQDIFKPFNWINSHFEENKKIEMISVPKQVGQAKYIGQKLKELSEEERNQTAIVLGDEQLLPSVLSSLPEEVQKLNITMGLPLKSVPLAYFFKSLFGLYYNREKFNNENKFYYKDVLNVLGNPSFKKFLRATSLKIQKEIIEENKIFISEEELQSQIEENFKPLFKNYKTPLSFVNGLIDWINLFQQNFELSDLENEYFFRFRSLFQQLLEILSAFNYVEDFKLLQQLYNQILNTETIAFLGEPLVGLQLLGVLETRLLDFKHIIFSSVNEGVFPIGRQENTFIPFDYRSKAKLNTFLENDAIYAYHFYRLIQRCESATFLYNTDSEGIGRGEPSRFLLQLDMESPHEIKKLIATPENTTLKYEELSIEKNLKVIEKLERWSQSISPSSLGTYLWNPIEFYERYVLGIRQDDEVEEVAGDQTLGNIVHNTIEQLYTPYIGRILHKKDFDEIRNNAEKVLFKNFDDLLLKGKKAQGKNILILNVAREMVNNVLDKDYFTAQQGELVFLALEKECEAEMELSNGRKIKFKGKIDRVDSFNGNVRVIDYKTGSFNARDLKVKETDLEKLGTDKKYAKAIQLLIYSYMYLNVSDYKEVSAGIFPLRFFSKHIELLSIFDEETLNRENILPVMQEIEHLIEEIFDEKINFTVLED